MWRKYVGLEEDDFLLLVDQEFHVRDQDSMRKWFQDEDGWVAGPQPTDFSLGVLEMGEEKIVREKATYRGKVYEV